MSEAIIEPVWTVVANLTREERGGRDPEQRFRGTPTFSPGARLYLGEVYWGMSQDAHMIGQNRSSKRFTNCVVDMRLLDEVRATLEYSSSTIAALRKLDARTFPDRAAAEKMAKQVQGVIAWLRAGCPAPE
jgi:hypothetical protein